MKANTQKTLVDGLIGFIAGVVATGPMTLAMIFWHRRLPADENYPLPPREITMKLAREAGVAAKMSPEVRSAATLLAHFGYGGAAGAIFAAFADRLPVKTIWKGIGFGLCIWTASYLGLLPGAGILKIVTHHPARRNLLMIAAHVIWGAVMGLVSGVFKTEAHSSGSQPLSSRGRIHKDTDEPLSRG